MAQPELLRLSNEAVELTLDQASLRGTIRLAATGDTWMLDILFSDNRKWWWCQLNVPVTTTATCRS